MAQDPFVFFIEGAHGPPSERDPRPQLVCVGRQVDVLPRCSRGALLARFDRVPGRRPEVRMPGGVLVEFQNFRGDVSLSEVGYGIPTWLEEQEDVLTIRDPGSAESYAHAPSQRLDVQKSS
jgi:hypothetical protein